MAEENNLTEAEAEIIKRHDTKIATTINKRYFLQSIRKMQNHSFIYFGVANNLLIIPHYHQFVNKIVVSLLVMHKKGV